METYSPCTPPPGEVQVGIPGEKQTPQKLGASDALWIRRHSTKLEEEYTTWVEQLKYHRDPVLRVRCLTCAERGRLNVSMPSSGIEPIFKNDDKTWEIISFARKYPHLLPRGQAEEEEFERRVWFMGISVIQGLELRRRCREVGCSWP